MPSDGWVAWYPSEHQLKMAQRRRIQREIPRWQGTFDLTWNYYVEPFRVITPGRPKENVVYMFHMHIEQMLFVKIGRATCPYRRMSDFSGSFPFSQCEMIRTCKTADIKTAGRCEKLMQLACKEFSVGGEWYGDGDRLSALVDSLAAQFEG
jgi:hypothetical protein